MPELKEDLKEVGQKVDHYADKAGDKIKELAAQKRKRWLYLAGAVIAIVALGAVFAVDEAPAQEVQYCGPSAEVHDFMVGKGLTHQYSAINDMENGTGEFVTKMYTGTDERGTWVITMQAVENDIACVVGAGHSLTLGGTGV